MLGKRFLLPSIFATSIVADSFGNLEARQVNPSACSATYYGSCTNSAQRSSATAWCSALGFGTGVVTNTVAGSGTTMVWKTVISTSTSFTSTATVTAATSTSTSSVTKTTTKTSISTLKVTSTTGTVTINAAGTIQSCGTYTATYQSSSPSASTPSTPVYPPTTSPTTSATMTSTPSSPSGSVQACTPNGAPSLVNSGWHSCPSDNMTTLTFADACQNRTSFVVQCNSDLRGSYVYYSGGDYNPGPYIPNVSSLPDCLARCLYQKGNACGGVTYLTGTSDGGRCYFRQPMLDWWNNDFTTEIYPPDWGLQYDNGGDPQWYWTAAQRLNYPPAPGPGIPESSEGGTPTDANPPAYSIQTQYLPQCTGGDCGNYQPCPQDGNTDLTFANYMGGQSTFHVSCGQDLMEHNFRTDYWVWAESLTACVASCLYDWSSACGGVTFVTEGVWYGGNDYVDIYSCWYRQASNTPYFSNTTWPADHVPNGSGSLVSALLTFQSAYSKVRRGVDGTVEERDGYKGAGSRIARGDSDAPYGMGVEKRLSIPKPVCLKVAPTPTATGSACNCVITSPTATRTATATLTATITSTRTIATTLKTVSTFTSTPITAITKTVATITATQTKTTTSTIKTAVSVTTTGTWTLASTPAAFYVVDQHNGVAMWPADADEIFYNVQYDDSPESTDPPPTVFALNGTSLTIQDFVDMDVVVVGQPFNGTGAQVMALETKNAARPNYLNCKVTANADGTCPLRCTDPVSGGNSSWQDTNGVWYLSPANAVSGTPFNSFVLQTE